MVSSKLQGWFSDGNNKDDNHNHDCESWWQCDGSENDDEIIFISVSGACWCSRT